MADLHEELEQEFLDIQDRLGDQDLLSDQVEYAKVAKRYSELGKYSEMYSGYQVIK